MGSNRFKCNSKTVFYWFENVRLSETTNGIYECIHRELRLQRKFFWSTVTNVSSWSRNGMLVFYGINFFVFISQNFNSRIEIPESTNYSKNLTSLTSFRKFFVTFILSFHQVELLEHFLQLSLEAGNKFYARFIVESLQLRPGIIIYPFIYYRKIN